MEKESKFPGKFLDKGRGFGYKLNLFWGMVKERAGSSVGRASALQAEGHRFKPCSAYHQKRKNNGRVVQFWLERRPVTPEVASSSLVAPAIIKNRHLEKHLGACFLLNFDLTPHYTPHYTPH